MTDAIQAESVGANYGGMILSQGFSRSIPPETGREISSTVGISTVGVLVEEELEVAESLANAAKVSVLQLHGKETLAYVKELSKRGDWTIWKVIVARCRAEICCALELWEPFVDGIVLDGWNPSFPGGTGTKFAWEEIGRLRDEFSGNVELVVAGGLNPSNVGDAIKHLDPDTVDVSSGVESRLGEKSRELMESFVVNARSTGCGKNGL